MIKGYIVGGTFELGDEWGTVDEAIEDLPKHFDNLTDFINKVGIDGHICLSVDDETHPMDGGVVPLKFEPWE